MGAHFSIWRAASGPVGSQTSGDTRAASCVPRSLACAMGERAPPWKELANLFCKVEANTWLFRVAYGPTSGTYCDTPGGRLTRLR